MIDYSPAINGVGGSDTDFASLLSHHVDHIRRELERVLSIQDARRAVI